jgi:hypothetical protein
MEDWKKSSVSVMPLCEGQTPASVECRGPTRMPLWPMSPHHRRTHDEGAAVWVKRRSSRRIAASRSPTSVCRRRIGASQEDCQACVGRKHPYHAELTQANHLPRTWDDNPLQRAVVTAGRDRPHQCQPPQGCALPATARIGADRERLVPISQGVFPCLSKSGAASRS